MQHIVDDGVVIACVHICDFHLEPLLLIQFSESFSIVFDVGVFDDFGDQLGTLDAELGCGISESKRRILNPG